MIDSNKLHSAIKAIQDLIIEARNLAYLNQPTEKIADLLDGVEYLPGLILLQEDKTEWFESYLEEICTKYNYPGIMIRYHKGYTK